MKIKEVRNFMETDLHGFVLTAMLRKHSQTLPWLNSTIARYCDNEYVAGISGDKCISPLFREYLKLLEVEGTTLDDVLERLGDNVYIHFGKNWTRIFNAYFSAEYNPLENYNMEEKENAKSNVKTSITAHNDVFGFDSSTASPSDASGSDTEVSSDMDDNERVLTRSGNIGVTTSQQMLQSELDLRKYDFFAMIYRDLDTVLCLAIYE